jgi:hypothetical protein
MNIKYLKQVRQMYASGVTKIDRHNQRQWIRSIRYLGDKWVLAVPNKRVWSFPVSHNGRQCLTHLPGLM